MPATPLYRSVMLELERRRLQLGWPMWRVDEVSGVQDGYYAKMLYADTPSGRQARWEMLQYVVEALFPEGFDTIIRPGKGMIVDGACMRRKTFIAQTVHIPKSQRELMAEMGRKGGAARAAAMTPHQRRRQSKRAAIARWRKVKLQPPEAGD